MASNNPPDPWILDTHRNKFYYIAEGCYIYADGLRLPVPAPPVQANQGAETSTQPDPIPPPAAVTSSSTVQHNHNVSGGSVDTAWSVNTGFSSLSLQDLPSSSSNDQQGNQPGDQSQNNNPQNDHPQNDHPQNDHSQNDHSQNDYSQNDHSQNDYPQNENSQSEHSRNEHSQNEHSQNDDLQNDPPQNVSCASSHATIPGAFEEQAYGIGSVSNLDSSAECEAQNPSQGAEEPSDTEKLKEVARLDDEPGPELPDIMPGLRSHKILRNTEGTYEKLDPNFKVQERDKHGRTYFKMGTVFRVLWPELASDRARENATIATHPRFRDEKIFIKIRWFVVIREGKDSATCLSIQTYGGRGVPPNKVKAHHSIIYTGPSPPRPAPSEMPQDPSEYPMGLPIRVISEKSWDKMDPMSRVNFHKLYTVEHYVKVHHFGTVASDNEWVLIHQFNSSWNLPQAMQHTPESATAYFPPQPSQSFSNYGPSAAMTTIQEQPSESYQLSYQQTGQVSYPSAAQSPYQYPAQAPRQYPGQGASHQFSQRPNQAPYSVPYQSAQPAYPTSFPVAGQPAFYQPLYSQPSRPQQPQYTAPASQQQSRTRRSSKTSKRSHPPRSGHPDDYRPDY